MQDLRASNYNRIAKNALMLYIRMAVATVIGLYTSRAILDALGAEDYGLYNVVGGIVTFLAFINGAMAGATSRFLAFEIGTGNKDKLCKTFTTALVIHLFLGVIIVLLAETLGLWFLKTKLVIPIDRFSDAIFVFHLSVLSTFLSVVTVPFSASTIAHERMDAYAYIEILNVLLKLSAVIVLQKVLADNKLVLYGELMLLSGAIITTIYIVYTRIEFKEVRFRLKWHSNILKPLFSFSSYSFFSTAAVAGKQQGIAFLINMFFGLAVNAANAIVTSVAAIVIMLSESVCNAFRPQIIKLYASNQKQEMVSMINTAIAISMPLTIIITSIIVFNRVFILNLWLVSVPKYTDVFLIFILIENAFSMFRINLNMGITATGKIKQLSILYSINLLLVLPLSYFTLSIGTISPYVIFGYALLSGIMGVLISFTLLKKEIKDYPIFSSIKELLKVSVTTLVVFLCLLPFSFLKIKPVFEFLVSSLVIICVVTTLSFLQMNSMQRRTIKGMIARNEK